MAKSEKGSSRIRGVVSAFLIGLSSFAVADPSTQVARCSVVEGMVRFFPAGGNSWVKAPLNRPLMTGDQLWSDAEAQAEIQLAGGMLKLGRQTNLKLLNLTSTFAQFQITEGTLVLDIQRMVFKQGYEVDTPNLAFTLATPGYYRIDVQTKTNTTMISVSQGQGMAYGTHAVKLIQEGQFCSAMGSNLIDYRCRTIVGPGEKKKTYPSLKANSATARYVSPNVIGKEALDEYGIWQISVEYGPVWVPKHVAANWAPYRDGYWIWLGSWGWTWVDENPWGFAPFHYGRWAYVENKWVWVPGPVEAEPVYAPALVAFIDGIVLPQGGLGVGWFPLAPGELYLPPYEVGQHYFMAVNLSNTKIDTAYALQAYKHRNLPIYYKNKVVANAVTVVPKKVLVESIPVKNIAVLVSSMLVAKARTTSWAAIAPESISVQGGRDQVILKPPVMSISRPIVVKTMPPPSVPLFISIQRLLSMREGRPLTPEETLRFSPKKQYPSTQYKHVVMPTMSHQQPVISPPPMHHLTE